MTNSTPIPLAERCFEQKDMLLMSDLEKTLIQYMFPLQFIVTMIGNTLTMSVLLSGHMKNRANHLLAFLALCDLMVFAMMFPHYLSSLDLFAGNVNFRLFHYHTKVHFGALSNWFSAAAIWFVLAVSVERLLIIKFPFRSLDIYNSKQIIAVSICIFIATFILTGYHQMSHSCVSYLVCNGTQVLGRCYPNLAPNHGRRKNPTSPWVRQWIELSVFLNAALAVLLPVLAVALINISLVRLLKKRNHQEFVVRSVQTSSSTVAEQERRMSNTVLAIVSCFTLTQGPSALVYIYMLLYPLTPFVRVVSIVSSHLVLTGKMLNVILFCLTSKTFRKKMLATCTWWMFSVLYCDRRAYKSKFSRTQSKSVVTQKTSIAYSPSRRGTRRASVNSSDNISMKLIKKNTEQSLITDRSDKISLSHM